MGKTINILSYVVLGIAVVVIILYFGKEDTPKQDEEVWNEPEPTQIEGDQLPEGEVSTTLKGGLMDSYSFIEKHMELGEWNSVSREYVLDEIKIDCVGSDGICTRSTYYFHGEDPATPEEAFQLLKEHLPTDSIVQEEFKLDEKRYVYNVKSDLMKENFSGLSGFYNEMDSYHLIFTFHPGTKKVILVVADLLYHISKP